MRSLPGYDHEATLERCVVRRGGVHSPLVPTHHPTAHPPRPHEHTHTRRWTSKLKELVHYADLTHRARELAADYRAEVDVMLALAPPGSAAAQALAAARESARLVPPSRVLSRYYSGECALV